MKSSLIAAAAAVIASAPLTHSAMAQQIVPPGQLTIDGYPFSCGSVPTFLVGNELGDAGRATPQGIYLNWMMLSQMPTAVKAFVYTHECGHMLYGPNENVADQFAIKLGRQQGWINIPILGQICGSVFLSPGDWTHLPGPARCQMMLAYFAN